MAAVLTFAIASIPVAALQLAVSVHLPKYFATNVGLSLVAVGAAFGLVRLIDIPIDTLLGIAMDRTRTRLGRYRVWVLAGAPVLMLGLYMLMLSPSGVGQGYLIGWLLVMYIGLSMMFLAHLAWGANIAPTYEQRSRIMSAITGLGVVGSVAVLLIPVIMDGAGATDAEGIQAMIWFIIIAAPVTALLVARTPERIRVDHGARFAVKDYVALLTRPNVLRVVIADFLFSLGPGWMAALYLFYFVDIGGFTLAESNLLLMIYIAAGFAGAPFTAWLANRISKHRALMVNTTVYSLSLAVLPFYPKGEFLVAIPGMFLAGAMFTGFIVMIRALAGDVGDEARLDNGREWMGLIYAMLNVTSKLASAVSIILTYNVLAAIGYDASPGAVNTPAAMHGLQLAYLIGPIVFVMIGGGCFIGYKLDSRRHAAIRDELDARDALALSPAEDGGGVTPGVTVAPAAR
jgi:Na+/melibiose symporter-like transporter